MAVIHVNSGNFAQEVLESTIPVLVDFYADWCGPCKMIAPTIEDLAQSTDYKVCKLNVDDAQDIAQQYRVMTIPTVIAFENGKEKAKLIGVQSKSAFENLIK